ncbi:HTH-type transcriptional regulator iscR [Cesiribacter andamanensis AMV16]|uniref:HTH-type transcriptional regulator iscR n=2 Tax=Cesiribacter TaxID=1133570 RepID=M7NME6_9BACT|nr:HTH-type transcriptional regulator iscR [Cesiribacter andamanensis AMV16]
MLTKTSEYAIRSLMYIAIHSSETNKVGIKEVASELELPLHFIGKILQDLVRKGIIASVKGPHGGFYLDRPASTITLMDVVRVIDGGEAFKRCGLGMKQCSDAHPCPLHEDFKVYRDGLARVFNKRTIHDLTHEVEAGHAFLTNLAVNS